ncbi:hypothetical protein SAMN05443545_106284 [Aidingimonas halophila]|uniref:Uncharacterized protein n=1 Tax=Aidingimonas halophila TaxID=574349 RepID=A0A1H3DGL1_9GAMM|nr:hypothetical protein GCM10008094_22640 [Aidingimonas halophila]SDX65470.1 hypothetical protein SAMN05443545_106284 [Aidingimonas halophila]
MYSLDHVGVMAFVQLLGRAADDAIDHAATPLGPADDPGEACNSVWRPPETLPFRGGHLAPHLDDDQQQYDHDAEKHPGEAGVEQVLRQ